MKSDSLNRRSRRTLLGAALLACAVANAHAALSAKERAIADSAASGQAAAEALLEKVVNIQSPTENIAGVRAVGDVFAAEFGALGMKTHWVEMPPEMKRAGHLVAEQRGTRGKRILLIGHIDTVLSGEPFRRDGTRAYGTGSDDMKGGDVVIVQALRALHASGALAGRRITVMLTGDEEDAGVPFAQSRGPLIALAKKHDAVLSFEAAVDGTATIGRRGIVGWRLEVGGETGHSSGIWNDDMGSGAVYEAARILEAFHTELRGEKYLTLNPAAIVGGTHATLGDIEGGMDAKNNVVAPVALVRGDMRFISREQERSVRERMLAIVARHHPKTDATLTFEESYPPMTPTPANEKLLGTLSQASEDLGLGPVPALDPGKRGAGDIGFIADLVPGLDGLGSGAGDNSHAPGEYTSIETLTPMAQRAAVLIYRLTR